MISASFLVPGPLDTRTGGYIYDRRIVDGLRRRGWIVNVVPLDESFPFPTAAALDHARLALAALPCGTIALIDSLAFGAMPHLVREARARLHIVAVVHLPLAADCTRDRGSAAALEAGERRAFEHASLVIVTGEAALPMIETYRIPPGRIVVVEPGTDRAPLARGSGQAAPTLLAAATLHHGKGYHVLLAALARLRHLDWRVICAGSQTRDAATAGRIRTMLQALSLQHRVSLVGELGADALDECYDRADVFVSASLQETYGMAIAEALARGLPVVATATGAAPRLLNDGAGLLVPPSDVGSTAQAIERVVSDGTLRAQLAQGARRVRERLPDWQHASARVAAALEGLGAHG